MAVTTTNLVVGGAAVTIGSDLGAIKDGITITPTREVFTIDLEQEMTPSKAWNVTEKWAIEFTLCEPTLANIKIGWDVDNTVTVGPPATLSFGDHQFTPQERVLVVTGIRPGATAAARTVTFHKAVLETPAPLVFTKRAETNLKCGFMGLWDSSNSRVGQISDAA